mmetsp:Transcript_104971/g.295658  ORF Transcript_104971/g.295658 Transcript_104971/m.295658 type:complete len:203 (-) Transcript_104971:213-821(-)
MPGCTVPADLAAGMRLALRRTSGAGSSHLLVQHGDGKLRLLAASELKAALPHRAVGLVHVPASVLEVRRGAGLLEVQGQRLHGIEDLVVQRLHDVLEAHPCHVVAVDLLHDPSLLDTGHYRLPLRVAGIARLRGDRHDHRAVAVLARGIALDAEGPLLESDLVRGASGGRGVHQGGVSVLGAVPQQVVHPDGARHKVTTASH